MVQSLHRFALLLATLTDVAVAYQTFCVVAWKNWEGTSDLKYKIDDNHHSGSYVRAHQATDWTSMGNIHTPQWAYTMTVSKGDTVSIQFKKGDVECTLDYEVGVDVYNDKANNYLKVDKADSKCDVSDAPETYIVMSRIFHQGAWKDYIRGDQSVFKHSDVSLDTAEVEGHLRNTWNSVSNFHSLEDGISLNVFGDGFAYPGDKIKFTFKGEDGRTKTTQKKLSKTTEGQGGTFAGWTVPKMTGGSITAEAEGHTFTMELPAEIDSVEKAVKIEKYQVGDREARLIFVLHTQHGIMDKYWRSVHKHHNDPEGTHPYWDHDVSAWNLDALTNLWTKVHSFRGVGGPDELSSAGGALKKRSPVTWVILLVVILLLLAALGAYFYLCQEVEDDSQSSDEENGNNAGKEATKEEQVTENNWPYKSASEKKEGTVEMSQQKSKNDK